MTRALSLLLVVLFLAGCSKGDGKLNLRSDAVLNMFRDASEPPYQDDFFTIRTGPEARPLKNAKVIPLTLAAYGSGSDINVSLVLSDPTAQYTREELGRAAMSAALTFCRLVQASDSSEDRPARATIYPFHIPVGESLVILATAEVRPENSRTPDFTFPGAAWREVRVVDRVPTELELQYLVTMQHMRYQWKIDGPQEDMRATLTPEQDAQLSKELDIKPGTVNMAPFVLKPLLTK